jgi:hypothetical protein
MSVKLGGMERPVASCSPDGITNKATQSYIDPDVIMSSSFFLNGDDLRFSWLMSDEAFCLCLAVVAWFAVILVVLMISSIELISVVVFWRIVPDFMAQPAPTHNKAMPMTVLYGASLNLLEIASQAKLSAQLNKFCPMFSVACNGMIATDTSIAESVCFNLFFIIYNRC